MAAAPDEVRPAPLRAGGGEIELGVPRPNRFETTAVSLRRRGAKIRVRSDFSPNRIMR